MRPVLVRRHSASAEFLKPEPKRFFFNVKHLKLTVCSSIMESITITCTQATSRLDCKCPTSTGILDIHEGLALERSAHAKLWVCSSPGRKWYSICMWTMHFWPYPLNHLYLQYLIHVNSYFTVFSGNLWQEKTVCVQSRHGSLKYSPSLVGYVSWCLHRCRGPADEPASCRSSCLRVGQGKAVARCTSSWKENGD